jgi:hypothetical protein
MSRARGQGDASVDGEFEDVLSSTGGGRRRSVHARRREPEHGDVDGEAPASVGLGKMATKLHHAKRKTMRGLILSEEG